MSNKGYVYILTNPSFREDWVKIGKTKNRVDIRSRELDNTAVPLPFEIYATVKTEKYSELEKLIHKTLTDIADKRIRPNREFFNFKPEDAFEHLKMVASLIDDAEINGPDEEKVETHISSKRRTKYKGKYHVDYEGLFYLKANDEICKGTMKIVNGKYILLEGSKIDPNIYTNEKSVKKLREENKDNLQDNIVIRDIEFGAPSTVGEFVKGRAVNGKVYWQTEDGRPLEDFIVYEE